MKLCEIQYFFLEIIKFFVGKSLLFLMANLIDILQFKMVLHETLGKVLMFLNDTYRFE